MNQIGLFKNENVPLPEQPVVETIGYVRQSNPFWFDSGINPLNNDVEVEFKFQMGNINEWTRNDNGFYRCDWSLNGYLMMCGFEDDTAAFKWHYGGGAIFFGTRTTDPVILKQTLTQCYVDGLPTGNTYTITSTKNSNIMVLKPQHGVSPNLKFIT